MVEEETTGGARGNTTVCQCVGLAILGLTLVEDPCPTHISTRSSHLGTADALQCRNALMLTWSLRQIISGSVTPMGCHTHSAYAAASLLGGLYLQELCSATQTAERN
jgi:hypothetical protein